MKNQSAKKKKPFSFWGWFKRNLFFIIGFGIVAALSIYGIVSQSTKRPPSFYEELMPPASSISKNADTAISKFQEIEKKKKPSRKKNPYKTLSLTQDEINSWIKARWLRSLTDAERKVLKDLRVRLTPEMLTVVTEVKSPYFEGFITIECSPKIDPKNDLEIEIRKCYSGLARLPISQVRKQILKRIPNNFPKFSWQQGTNRATIDLSNLVTAKEKRPVEIKSVEIKEREVLFRYRVR